MSYFDQSGCCFNCGNRHAPRPCFRAPSFCPQCQLTGHQFWACNAFHNSARQQQAQASSELMDRLIATAQNTYDPRASLLPSPIAPPFLAFASQDRVQHPQGYVAAGSVASSSIGQWVGSQARLQGGKTQKALNAPGFKPQSIKKPPGEGISYQAVRRRKAATEKALNRATKALAEAEKKHEETNEKKKEANDEKEDEAPGPEPEKAKEDGEADEDGSMSGTEATFALTLRPKEI